VFASPSGGILTQEEFDQRRDAWLPSESDRSYVESLMQKPVYDPKQMAHWISAPKQGIKGRPVDFEYVRRA
jgi:benzoyl-CoA 2,3-dioxygenase component B